MKIDVMEKMCRNKGDREGCLEIPDEKYTLNFDDINQAPIYWCSVCGPEAMALHKLFEQIINDPTMYKIAEAMIVKAEMEERLKKS